MTTPAMLICYDGSDTAKEAIERTAQLHPGAEVAVLSVWQPMQAFVMSWGLMAGDLGHMDSESRKAAQQLVAEGATIARAAGLEPTPYVAEAPYSVGRTILDWARVNEVKLIVIGATGHSAFADAMSGSVANAVVHHATAPVLLVRLPERASTHHHEAEQVPATAAR